MAGVMEPLVEYEKVEKAHRKIEKVMTEWFFVSCEMQRQWDWEACHEQID